MLSNNWRKIKRSGTFYRKLKRNYQNIINDQKIKPTVENFSGGNNKKENVGLPSQNENGIAAENNEEDESTITDSGFSQALPLNADRETELENWMTELDSDPGDQYYSSGILCAVEKNAKLREDIRLWAVSNNVPQLALKKLFTILNERIPNCLPQDPRTLLKTRQTIVLIKVGTGSYWHNGLEASLRNVLNKLNDIPKQISINVNMDGLPIFKSSKKEFWPIIYNIYELPIVRPMIIGIYYGMGKPTDLEAYLEPFVQEAKILLTEGIIINGVKIVLKIRSFICDSPARAFIKGKTIIKAL